MVDSGYEINGYLVTKKRTLGYVNELTIFLDSNMENFKRIIDSDGFPYTYLNEIKSSDNMLLIRFPGASRGHVKVDDNNIIQDIHMYSVGRATYGDDIEEKLQKFIGYKIIEQQGE